MFDSRVEVTAFHDDEKLGVSDVSPVQRLFGELLLLGGETSGFTYLDFVIVFL
jgi:hypothetical protein